MKSSIEDIKKVKLNAILLVKWGLGLEIAKVLVASPDVAIRAIITQHDETATDKWYNAVYNYGIQSGVATFDEQAIPFAQMKNMIQEGNIDVLIVHSFMRKISREIFTAPRYGAINIHASLLPKYRGPSPNYWVIRNKEKITGFTSHFMNEEIDGGDIIAQQSISVTGDDTVESLIEKEKQLISPLLSETLDCLRDVYFKPVPQQRELVSYAPRPEKDGGTLT